MTNILKTAFHTSALSYVIFFLADILRPGFVSATFSVHWLLLAAIVSGMLFAIISDEHQRESFFGRVWRWLWQCVFAVVLAVLVWEGLEEVGDLRIFVALVGFCVPWIVPKLLTYER